MSQSRLASAATGRTDPAETGWFMMENPIKMDASH
jgi:hypothetical protein